MLTSFILALIKLLSNPVLVAALAKFLANALKTVSYQVNATHKDPPSKPTEGLFVPFGRR